MVDHLVDLVVDLAVLPLVLVAWEVVTYWMIWRMSIRRLVARWKARRFIHTTLTSRHPSVEDFRTSRSPPEAEDRFQEAAEEAKDRFPEAEDRFQCPLTQ